MDSTQDPLTGGSNPYQPILPSQVMLGPEGQANATWDDIAAASLVQQDYERARAFVDNNMWQAEWEDNDILYQPTPGIGQTDERYSRVARFGVNNSTNTMGDAVKDGLFSQKPPFFLRPRGNTTQATVDAWTALLDVLLDRMGFRYWAGLGIESQTLHGTCIWKGGWSTRKVKVRRRKRAKPQPNVEMPVGGAAQIDTKESDELVDATKEVEQSYPWLEFRMLGTTIFDPNWRTPNKPDLCGYAIDVDYPTFYDLDTLRRNPAYQIPDAEALKKWFFHNFESAPPTGTNLEQVQSDAGSAVMHSVERSRPTSADPLMGKMMMLERSDAEKIQTILIINSRALCIRNGENELGRIPHFTANWRNKPNNGYGMGTGQLAGGDQRLETGVLNHAINLLAYQLSPAILIAMGLNAPTQNREVRAGGFFEVQPIGDDVRKAMAVMEMPQVPPQAWEMIQYSQESREQTVGDDKTFMQGQLGGKGSSAARTATGAGAISAKSNARIQTPVENIEMGLIVPYLNMLIDMVKMKMPLQEIRELLETKHAKAIVKQILSGDSFWEAEVEVEVLAGAKLKAKLAMAQQLPFLMQIFQQPQLLEQLHAEGKTVDLNVILDVLFEVSEFRNEKDIIRDMTDEEKQMVSQSNPAQAKTQSDLAVEQQKGKNLLDKSDRDAENKLGVDLATKAVERLGEGLPLTRAQGLVERGQDERVLQGQGEPVLAGVE